MESEQAQKLRAAILEQFTFDDDASLAVLDAAIQAYDLMQSAQALLDNEGLVVKGDRGGIKAHPAAAILRDARAQFFAGIKALNLQTDDAPARTVGSPTAFDRWQATQGRHVKGAKS